MADNHEYPANPAVEAEPLIRETFGTDFKRDPLRSDVLGSLNDDAVRAMDTAELRLAAMARRCDASAGPDGWPRPSSSRCWPRCPIAALAIERAAPEPRGVAAAVGHAAPRSDRHDDRA